MDALWWCRDMMWGKLTHSLGNGEAKGEHLFSDWWGRYLSSWVISFTSYNPLQDGYHSHFTGEETEGQKIYIKHPS